MITGRALLSGYTGSFVLQLGSTHIKYPTGCRFHAQPRSSEYRPHLTNQSDNPI